MLDTWDISSTERGAVAYLGDAPSDITAAHEVGIPSLAAAWAPTSDANALEAMHPAATFRSVEKLSRWIQDKLGVFEAKSQDSSHDSA